MAFLDRSFMTSSPVLALQAQPAHQFGFERPIFQHQSQSFSHSGSWSQRPLLRSNSTFAGRKRSRDEAAVNLDEPEKMPPLPPVDEPEDEWEYGPGMTLIKKSTRYVAGAGSQSGTWVEEKAAEELARKTEIALIAQEQLAQARPSLRSNKSQRLDMTGTLVPGHEILPSRTSPARDLAEPSTQPIVDDFTLHLGIGWYKISDDEHIQAAARGWARYIENHYAVSDVKIRLESKGLQSYLVEAAEGYFLFSEDLRQGRLVSKDANRALQNLSCTPPQFDAAEALTSTGTPRSQDADLPDTALQQQQQQQHEQQHQHEQNEHIDLDMDMN